MSITSDTDTAPVTRGPDLTALLETYQAWSSRQLYARVARKADEQGDHDGAQVLRRMLDEQPEVSALDALAAQREILSLLAGWQWLTVRAARDAGASWEQIARTTHRAGDAETERDAYLEVVERQADAAVRYGFLFPDVEGYRAAGRADR